MPEPSTAAAPLELGAELDRRGVPRHPVLVVGPHSFPSAPPRTASALRAILVVAVEDEAPSADLLTAADVVIARDGDLPGAVAHPAPTVAATEFAARAAASPRAAVALAELLRAELYADVRAGLIAESALYSTLLASEEFGRWLAHRGPAAPPASPEPRLRIVRDGDLLRVTLDRAARRNALDARLRDELLEALDLARWDPALRVLIEAAGPSFSSGGELAEFGTAGDPAASHLVRLQASVGAAIDALRDRVTVRVHGHSFGAGVELPAFAGRVIADREARFSLPEVAMGLIPGAGGTTSVPRRIGRRRALWLAVSGAPIDAATAFDWGLVDELD
ncbi:MAG: enoyl-CoA hydratase/isomerase family protein [Solirubrobacterales bacterium]